MAKISYITNDNQTHTIDVENGLTVMEGAVQNDIPGIDADCGGGMACATCHVYVNEEWFDKIPVKEDGEEGKGGCDGYNDTAYFESKARANTMKGSQSVEEITHKLNHAISENKEFILFVLVDLQMKKEDLIKLCEKNMINSEGTSDDLFSRLTEIDDPYRSRKIPLHKGKSMKKIEEVEGYNPQKHQWISGLEIFKYLFPDINPESVKKIITDCISGEYKKRT